LVGSIIRDNFINYLKKKRGEKPYRSAQPSTLAAFPPWGSSTGAGRMALTSRKCNFIDWKLPTF